MTKKKDTKQVTNRKGGGSATARIPLAELIDVSADRKELERLRCDIWWGLGLVGAYAISRLREAGCTDQEKHELMATIKNVRHHVTATLRKGHFDSELTSHEVRGIALRQYINDCLVIVNDSSVSTRSRDDAAKKIDAIWKAVSKNGAKTDARKTFLDAVDKTAHAKPSQMFDALGPAGNISIRLSSYLPDVANRIIRIANVGDWSALLTAWTNESAGKRKGARDGKWTLAAKLWNLVSNDQATADDMRRARPAIDQT